MYLGVDYYPEHWDRKLIDEDLDNIKELNCNIIRIGDFAWNIFEPQEGIYDFALFDEVIAKAKKRGIKVMMCIPTATMPKWLHEKYPDIMNQDEFGHPQPYGGRRGYCYNSDIYFKKALNITQVIANHYKNEGNIIAWQLDNEIGHEGSDRCYCPNCRNKFDQYLKNKYQSIYELNQRYGTNFWAHQYNDFNQIDLPRTSFVAQNPSLRLDFERFESDSIVNFLKGMYETIKKEIPDSVVLHDFEGGTLGKHFDPFKVSECFDDIAYNNYPVWGGTVDPMKPWEIAFSLDCARGFKQKNFWITEEIMGAQGHDVIGCAVKPNQGSAWAIQALAHGCKSFLIFRYRGFNKGAEMFCYGILDADNVKRRKYFEVQKLYSDIQKHADLFQKEIENKVALVVDYDSIASFRVQRQSDSFDFVSEANKIYRQLYLRDIGCDIITKNCDIKKYDLVIVPYMIISDNKFADKLKYFVASGGKVIFTPRTFWKDEDNNLVFGERMPLGLTELTGIKIDETESLLANRSRKVIDENGNQYEGYVFAEYVETTTAKALMTYKDNEFGNLPAVTVNVYGKGQCYYLTTSLSQEGLEKVFDIVTNTKTKKEENVEVVTRGDSRITIDYQNFTYEIKE